MAYNGSGNFSPDSAYFPVVSGALIESAKFNGTVNDIATGLSNAITKDGQTTISDNLPMSGFRHTGVGNAATRTDYAATGQVQDSAFLYAGTAGGTANAITLALTPAISAYATGQSFTYKSSAAVNTGAMTVNVNGVEAKAIQKNGAALVAGDHPASKLFRITYDGTAFQLEQVTLATVDTTSTQTISGVKTFSGNNVHSGANTFSGNNTHSGTETHTEDIILSGSALLWDRADVAAHATNSNIWVSNFTAFTGSAVTFTDFADAPQTGAETEIYCNAAHTFVHSANIVIQGSVNYTAEVGDRIRVKATTTTTFFLELVRKEPYATKAEMEAGTARHKTVTPFAMGDHPGVAKAYVVFDGTGATGGKSLMTSYGVTGVNKNGTGNYTVSFSTNFSSINYAVSGFVEDDGATGAAKISRHVGDTRTAGALQVKVRDDAGTAMDSAFISLTFHGDQ